jgi:hypothetical protein
MNGSEKTLSYGQGMQSCGRVTSTSFYRRIGKNLQRGHIRPPPPQRRRHPLLPTRANAAQELIHTFCTVGL